MITTNTAVAKRCDFVYLFDVKDGNPNGDPDFANSPRFDPETFQGLVSDVCLKRKIRDYVYALKTQGGPVEAGYDVYVLQGNALEQRQRMPYDDNLAGLKDKAKGNDTDSTDVERARDWMCEHFFDVRAFGAVMSTTEFRCGQVRGACQITFARSFHRVLSTEHGITRVAFTTESKKAEKASGSGEMGNKHTVAYGLYCAHGFVNANLALKMKNGFTKDDLEVFWKALISMFDLDHSAARGLMAARNLFVFEHESALGEAPAHKLFDLVERGVRLADGVEVPRRYQDYVVPSLAEVKSGLLALTDKIHVTDKANP